MAMRTKSLWPTLLAAFFLLSSSAAAFADTFLMPKRDMLRNTSEVVWGASTLANGTAFTLDYGDGSAATAGNVADRSYIAFNHTYALAGTYTVTLTVGAEQTTTEVRVYDAAALNAFDLRAVNINRTIQNGLRYLWTSQTSRAANFPAAITTSWDSDPTYTALVVLAFENQGFLVPSDNSAPTGLFQRFVVQRGLNFIFDSIRTLSLSVQPAGSPCVGAGIEAAPCTGLYSTFDAGYSTAVVSLPISASGALNRTVQAGLGAGQAPANYVVGKTYREVLQRLMNSVAFGQNDGATTAAGRGGWIYGFANNATQTSDGSTIGWDVLSQLDASASGVTVPAFVKTEFATYALPNGYNASTGTFDYNADKIDSDGNTAYPNIAKTAVGVQGFFYTGVAVGDARVQKALTRMSASWETNNAADYPWGCNNASGQQNKGCSYGMYNSFKALKLYGIQTLAGVARPAGPGPIAANDWHADYEDWLVANQTLPTATNGGYWGTMGFSCCANSTNINAAVAELILAPVALIQPDPTLFSTVGLSPATATNPVNSDHTVTATAESATHTPIPGATIAFKVLDGPNAGKTGSGVSNAQGQVTFTYHGDVAGTDHIQANIGALLSNIVEKKWVVLVSKCDVDSDQDIDNADLEVIRLANRQNATGPNDPRDGNGDGKITVADYRYCQTRLTN
jgi:hypothetical protein